MQLWEHTPGLSLETPLIHPYIPDDPKSRAAIIIFAGGGYGGRAPHEDAGYAEFFKSNGIPSFVVDYRVGDQHFPMALLDARRAVRWVRAHADDYGVDTDKIAVMGSSAGGHLAAMVSTFQKDFPEDHIDEIDRQSSSPNAQILCYPVICGPDAGEAVFNWETYSNLMGGPNPELARTLDPERNVTDSTPPAFIWHTITDPTVHVANSLRYTDALHQHNVPVELHIFPHGAHGLGLAQNIPGICQWPTLLLHWLADKCWVDM